MVHGSGQYFLTIVKEGSLNRAAEVLYVSQPSLSKYIQRLERQLGTPLFDRSVSPMVLNEAGRLYYRYLLEQAAQEEEMMTRLSQIRNMERGTLRVGIPSYCGQCYLPWVLKAFREEYPHVSLELFEGRGAQIELAVADQTVDLGIVHLPVSTGALRYQSLFSERVLLAAPNGEAERGAEGQVTVKEASIRDFPEYSFIMPHPEQKLGRLIADLFCRTDFSPKVLVASQTVPTVMSLVANGLGVGFVPAGGLGALPHNVLDKITFYRVRELEPCQWKLVALRRKGYCPPKYTSRFIELLTRHGQNSNRIDGDSACMEPL